MLAEEDSPRKNGLLTANIVLSSFYVQHLRPGSLGRYSGRVCRATQCITCGEDKEFVLPKCAL
jgi:hypothetical protein